MTERDAATADGTQAAPPTAWSTFADAIQVAVALELGDELEGIVTYDERLANAAARYGIAVVAPR